MAFKDLFTTKKQKERKAAKEAFIAALTPTNHECSYCNQDIYQEEGWTKLQGQYYHRNCWKEMRRMAGI